MKEQAPALLLSFFRQMLMTWHKISGFDSQNPGILCFLLFVENNESLFTHLDKVQVKSLSQHYCVAILDQDGGRKSSFGALFKGLC